MLYKATVELNEEVARNFCKANGMDFPSDAPNDFIMQEFGWLDESGIYLKSLEQSDGR